VLFHGTAAERGPSIATKGLVESCPGRGVCLTAEPEQAIAAAVYAVLKLRQASPRADLDVLVCHVNVEGLRAVIVPGRSPGWGPHDEYVVRAVERWRVVRFERVAFEVPPVGGSHDVIAASTGYARYAHGKPLMELAERMVSEGAAERVKLRADRHCVSGTITDYIDSLPRAELGETA
jgi:hypothetical protein